MIWIFRVCRFKHKFKYLITVDLLLVSRFFMSFYKMRSLGDYLYYDCDRISKLFRFHISAQVFFSNAIVMTTPNTLFSFCNYGKIHKKYTNTRRYK